jgi:hypothetical protein
MLGVLFERPRRKTGFLVLAHVEEPERELAVVQADTNFLAGTSFIRTGRFPTSFVRAVGGAPDPIAKFSQVAIAVCVIL